ncbi:hypothetical protein Tco_0409666 [Tanacetum coccineum]
MVKFVDRHTKSSHLFTDKGKRPYGQTSETVLEEVGSHGMGYQSRFLVIENPRFTSNYWGCHTKAMGTRLENEYANHPENDWTKRKNPNHTLEDDLRS